jgi:hypothetical protein
MKAWFDVDKEGLGKLLERRGKEFAIAELISNGWDTNATSITATLTRVPDSRQLYHLAVEDDDPDGFQDLAHAYTLFAESVKKGKADKRGRFNLGEKLVLAVCTQAEISSTKGSVRFDGDGRRTLRNKRDKGSLFEGMLKMTAAEYEQAVSFVRTLIPPPGVRTVFNGEELQARQPKAEFSMPLETHIADEEGLLKKSIRKTLVRVYEPLADEIPSLYEMGIPVVETNDKWHIDIQQKLPLSFERDNVPPAYLRKLRAEVLNHLFQEVRGEDISQSWVKQATEAPEAKPEAVNHYLNETFGPKRVIYDPSDQEANKLAVSQGYTVISPRSLSAGQWDHVRENKLALPAGQVTPSHKVNLEMTLGGKDDSVFIPDEKWNADMKNIARFSEAIAARLGIGNITVQFTSNISANYAACYGNRRLIFAVGRLGYQWFKDGVRPAVYDLLIHELAHEYSGDHLSEAYHDAMSSLGAKMTSLALNDPQLFAQFGATSTAARALETLQAM